MQEVASKLRLELAQFEEVARFTRFGFEVNEATRRQIRRGERARAVLKQPVRQPLSLASQIAVLLAATEGYLDDIALEEVPAFEEGLLARLEAEHMEICHQVNTTGELSEGARETFATLIVDYRTTWLEAAEE
jgi:F-type H+-transporting ATPase subunit alpha